MANGEKLDSWVKDHAIQCERPTGVFPLVNDMAISLFWKDNSCDNFGGWAAMRRHESVKSPWQRHQKWRKENEFQQCFWIRTAKFDNKMDNKNRAKE